jgi:hypothetical protein
MHNFPQKTRKIRNCFTKEEDEKILEYIKKLGSDNWKAIEKLVANRDSRACKERWKNVLSTSLSNKDWTLEEDELLLQLVNKEGNHWTKFTQYFDGRTDVLIKNRFSLLMRHKSNGKNIVYRSCYDKTPIKIVDDNDQLNSNYNLQNNEKSIKSDTDKQLNKCESNFNFELSFNEDNDSKLIWELF